MNTALKTCCVVACLLFYFSGSLAEIEDNLVDENNQGTCDKTNGNLECNPSSAKYGFHPGTVDYYEWLWERSKDLAEQTLQTDFLKHVQFGDLSADVYMSFTIQGIYYLKQVTEMLLEMSEKENNPEIKEFFQKRYNSYSKYGQEMLKQFNLKTLPDITPIPAIENYISAYKSYMEGDPILFVVSLLPCNRLWLWIANQLEIKYSNPYFPWKKANKNGHPEKNYKGIINKYVNAKNANKALEAFRKQMQNEHDFFAASLVE